MRRYAIVTAITAALAFAALAADAHAPRGIAAVVRVAAAGQSQTSASPSAKGGGGGGGAVDYKVYRAPARRGRGVVYGLMCAAALALAFVAYAVARVVRGRRLR